MNKEALKIIIVVMLASLVLSACSPRIVTEVTKSFPARSVEEVRVYDVGDTVPNSAVAIGKVAVLNRGFTTNCGYDRMLGLAKERTAENGGNGLLLTEHKEPKFWGSSCHQLMGMMFLMSDSIIDMTKPNAVMEGTNLHINDGNADKSTMFHEYVHTEQQLYPDKGWAGFYGTIFIDYISHIGESVYDVPGTLENEALILQIERFGRYRLGL